MSGRGKNKLLTTWVIVLSVVLVILSIVAVSISGKQNVTLQGSEPSTTALTEPETEATEPPITKTATATIGATGDILMHDLVIKSGLDKSTGAYNYDYIFEYFSKCASQVDFAAANLEVTLCSNTNGYKYQGYPRFNSPDAIVDALKNAGFDMLLTANNHSYDTGSKGFTRTQQVIMDAGLPHIGSRPSVEHKNYYVADVNGIKVGMINYTYNTAIRDNGAVALNGLPLSVENTQLINTFNYNQLDTFYSKLADEIEAMRGDGAEAIMLYIHWGNEYQIKENATQRKIAQQLCNLGVDVIVGNHAHVPQPVALLISEKDATKKTLCLYSTGNALSNIYKTKTRTVHTEDGMLFTVTFAKYSDGTVLVESTRVIPTWVYRYEESGVRKYRVLYMDDTIEDWKTLMNLNDSTLKLCQDSYTRTQGIVGAGVTEANQFYAENQKKVEETLGIGEIS